MVASGVRRSCETDCNRADLSASLWRAISAAWDSAARRSWVRAWPIWSAADDRSRVAARVGLALGPIAKRPDRAGSRCTGLDPDSICLSALGLAGAPPRAWPDWWTRLQRAGVSPGVRCSDVVRAGHGRPGIRAGGRPRSVLGRRPGPTRSHLRPWPLPGEGSARSSGARRASTRGSQARG